MRGHVAEARRVSIRERVWRTGVPRECVQSTLERNDG